MIKFEETEVVGWRPAIRGMRNPMNSHHKSDSHFGCGDTYCYPYCGESCTNQCEWMIGPNDLDLMIRLRNAGTDHRKFMRMIAVYVDITAPLYWWKEADTYAVGVVKNSCSTMHKIHAKEFTMDDFSHEHLMSAGMNDLNFDIERLNHYRDMYLVGKDKVWWWHMIQRLPTSYNQKRTVMLNYEVLTNMYHARKHHKLDEWHELCRWVETLPYAKELILGEQ